jgi:sodium-dependent dicarboxylate transporter 2/3/5
MEFENPGMARKIMDKIRPRRNAFYFMLSFLVAMSLTIWLRDSGFTQSQDYVLFLLIFSIGLWLTEAIPPFAVALFIMAYLVFMLGNSRFNAHPEPVSPYVQTFSNSIIWLMLGGFFLAESMTKTGIDAEFFRFCIRLSGKRPKHILLGVMLTTMVASMLLSNTATTSMLIATMTPLLNKLKGDPFSKALIVGIPLAATLGGMGTIIGSPTNAIAAGELENIGVTVSFLNWMTTGIPLAIVLTLISWWVLKSKYIKGEDQINMEWEDSSRDFQKISKSDRIIVLTILLITIGLWMTSVLHKLSVAQVAAIPIVFLPMVGIIKAKDVRSIPWDTLLLVAGGLSLGLALQQTHLLEHFAKHIIATQFSTYTLVIVLAYITMLFSNIMSNTATSTILIPLGIYLMPDHASQIAVIIGLAASTALLLPISTPPNAVAYSTGMVKQKEFLTGGLLVGLLGPILIVLAIMLIM